MENFTSPIFDGNKMIDSEKTSERVARKINRELGRWEQCVIDRLYDDCAIRLKNERFVIDEDGDLLVRETDDRPGIVDLTEDYACVFKTESVYASSPKDIAAQVSDVNGKLYREMSVCGAQLPTTLLSLTSEIPVNVSGQTDLQNAVKEIGTYGNVFGAPAIIADNRYNDSAGQEITVDLLTVGLIDKNAQLSSACFGEGNPIYLIDASAKEKQIQSNAFAGRTLYEMICDMHDEGAIVAGKNVGRTGILGACIDMIVAGAAGIELSADALIESENDFPKLTECVSDKVILIIDKEYSLNAEKMYRKWNKQAVKIGVAIPDRKLAVMHRGTTLVDLPGDLLSLFDADVPKKDIPLMHEEYSGRSLQDIPQPDENREIADFMLTCPNLLSSRRFSEQFDSTIGTNNLTTNFISDAAVMQIKGARHALAMSFRQNAVDIQQYPEAVNLAVAESIRRVVCSGGTPRILTGCLSCSGVLDAETEHRLHAINEHIALACRKMGIASSGVGLNCARKTGKPSIDRISIGTVAFLNDKHQHMTMSFKNKGDMIYLLGKTQDNLDSSEYIRSYHDMKDTPPPKIDIDTEAKLLRVAQKIIARKLVKSAHSVSRGGLFMALLESAMVRSFGFDITVDDEIRKDAFLFGESPSRIVVSVAMARETDFIDFMMESEVPFLTLGHITREEIRIDDNSYGFISDYKKKYSGQ